MARRSPFLINVTRLLRGGPAYNEVITAPVDDLEVSGSRVVPGSDVVTEVTFEPAGGAAVNVRGTVTVQWEGPCRRCLKDVRDVTKVDVLETFEEDFDEGETYPLVHSEVDLEQMVREAVLPELPQAPLCSEDCQGLCPECGANRNEGPCGHEGAPADPRWAALDELREN